MKPSFRKFIIAALLAGIVAAIINSILFFVFHATGVITDSVMIQNNQPLTIIPVIIFSLVPSLLAGVVFYLLCRYTKRGYSIFVIIALILLIVSFANPFIAIQDIPVGMGVVLNIMHIIVVGSILYFFRRTQTHMAEARASKLI